MKINLPWPPSVNHYWRNARGRTLISREGRAYRREVEAACRDQKIIYTAHGRLSISIGAYPPDRRRRDLDNLLKATLDSLQHAGVFEDDNQIDEIHIARGAVVDGGALQIEIEELR